MSRKKKIDAEIEIIDTEFPNKGIGYFNDNKITIKNTITGQKVFAQVTKKKHKYEGRVLKVLKEADYEITPECNEFGQCGGCTYQNISYEKELQIKTHNVLKILNDAMITDYEFLGIDASPSKTCYRNKMEFSFGDSGIDSALTLGMRKRASYYEVVNADNCQIVDEDIRKVLVSVREFFKLTNEKFYHKMKKTGSLRHLLIRQSFFTKEMLVNIVTTSDLKSDLECLKKNLLSLDINSKITGIIHIINDSVADVVKADEIKVLYGNDYFTEKLLDLSFKVSVFSFFQTNSAGAEVLYSNVRDFVGDCKNKVIFDLYCGTGTIAQIVAKTAKKVIGIEIIEEAVEAAKENAKLNNINNCEFIAGDVLKTIDLLNEKPDLIILDPPREGIHPKAINKIINFNADNIVYISCKASSMANDLKIFIENGYTVKKIKCVDMFPRTYHIECVVKLCRDEKQKVIQEIL